MIKKLEFKSAARAHANSVPEDPAPFTMKEFVQDAYSYGYEKAMKDGLQRIEDALHCKGGYFETSSDNGETLREILTKLNESNFYFERAINACTMSEPPKLLTVVPLLVISFLAGLIVGSL